MKQARSAAQTSPPTPPRAIEDEHAWAFCWQSLVQVSRTFSRPIEMLPPQLRAATTCGYLLCRIADTVEDDGQMAPRRKDALFSALLDVLEDGAPAERFTGLVDELGGRDAELTLAANLDAVLAVFSTLPAPMQRVCVQWVGEMVRGMSLYGHRRPDADDTVVLTTLADLERYCYFVAGTVGQMLTGLFCAAMPDLSDDRAARMRRHAEGFGLGLQMVNILKDQTDDLQRGWCFIPQTLWDAQEMSARQMTDPQCRVRAHAAVAPVFQRARQLLDEALEYTLAIPPEHTEIRLFCLLPLWMAARTLVLAQGNDAMFEAGEPVKISREEVGRLIGAAVEYAGDDDALRADYAGLWEPAAS